MLVASTCITLPCLCPRPQSNTTFPSPGPFPALSRPQLTTLQQVWGPHGMHSWSINRFANPDPFSQQPAPWAVQTTVYWPSMDAFKAAMADPGSQVTGADVPKFTNVFPVIWTGEVGAGEGREGIEGNKNFVYGEGGY